MHLSKKLKTFSEFFISFLKVTFIFEHLEKKVTLITEVLTRLLTLKDVLT